MKIEIEFSAPVYCEGCRFYHRYRNFGKNVFACSLYKRMVGDSEYNTEDNRKLADECITEPELLLLEKMIGYVPNKKKIFNCLKNEILSTKWDMKYRHLYEQDLVRIKEQDRSKELPDVITYYVTEKGFKIMERILKIRIKNGC